MAVTGTLREITGEMMQLMIMLEDEPDSDVLKDTLEGLSGELDTKAENYVYVIKEYEGQIENIKKEIERLSARKKTAENAIERLKNALLYAMQTTNTKKCGGNLYTISVRNNAPQLGQLDESRIPEKYFNVVTEKKLDKKTLLADVKVAEKEGKHIDGVDGLRVSQSLSIK